MILTPIRKNFFRKIFPILVNRKNFFRKIFQNWSIAKISSAKNSQFFYDDLKPNFHNIQIFDDDTGIQNCCYILLIF